MKRNSIKIDYPLLVVVVLLVFIGALTVFSASYYELEIGMRESAHRYFKTNLIYASVGLILMLVMSFFPYEAIKKFIRTIIIITIVSMVYVIFWGESFYGAKRWIRLGSITFMPLELTKACVIVLIAWYRDRFSENFKSFKSFSYIFLACMALVVLAIPQKDLATVVLLMGLIILLLFVVGTKVRNLLSVVAIGGVMSLILLFIESYRLERITIWLDTLFDRTYMFSDQKRQIMNSIYAISSGGLSGKGIGMSEFSKFRLSQSYSDFIFSIYVEEFGLIGAFVLLVLFAFLIYRIFKIAMECDDIFGFTIAAGTGILILLQIIINIGVALAILPTTGIPLPFISKGGTSLLILLILVGVVLNISSSNNQRKYIYKLEKKGN